MQFEQNNTYIGINRVAHRVVIGFKHKNVSGEISLDPLEARRKLEKVVNELRKIEEMIKEGRMVEQDIELLGLD